MAKTLSKTGITNGQTIQPSHVTQSIDAFTGTEAYDITLSGSASDSGFIAFDSLTEEKVLEWVHSNVDKSSIETSNSASIAQAIVRQAARTTKRGTPWD